MALKKGGEVATKNGIAELAKRVPPNQLLSFKDFQAKHAEYLARVNKQPEKLPNIDWEYYRRNVRVEFVKMVQEFEQKYKGVCEAYDKRGSQDKSKYFVEIDKLRQQVQAEVDKYKAESNERIKKLEAKYASIKALKPYEQMTAEEYAELLPEKSFFMYEGQPSFWPHTPDEQGPGPSFKDAHGHGHDDHGGGGADGHGGGKGDSSDGGAAEKSAAPAEPQKSDSKPNEAKSATAAAAVQKTFSAVQTKTAEPEACFESEQFKNDLAQFKQCFEEETKTIPQKSNSDKNAVKFTTIEVNVPSRVTLDSRVIPLQAATDDIHVIEPINVQKSSGEKKMPSVTIFEATGTSSKRTANNTELAETNISSTSSRQLKSEIDYLVKSTVEAFKKLREAESAGIVILKDDQSFWMNEANSISTTVGNQTTNSTINAKPGETHVKGTASNEASQFNTISKDELMQILNEMSKETTTTKAAVSSTEFPKITLIDDVNKVDAIKSAGISNSPIDSSADPILPKSASMNIATSGIAGQKSTPKESTTTKAAVSSTEFPKITLIDDVNKVDAIKSAGISNSPIDSSADPILSKSASMNIATSGIAGQKSTPTVVSSFRSESTQATNITPEPNKLKQEMDKLVKSTVEAFKHISKAESDGIISSQAESAAMYLVDDEPLLMKTSRVTVVQKDTEEIIPSVHSGLIQNPASLESDKLKQDMANLAKSTVEAFAFIAKAKSDGFISSQAKSAAVFLKDDDPLLLEGELKTPNILLSDSDKFQQEMFDLMKTTVETFAQFAEAEATRRTLNSDKTDEKKPLKGTKKDT